MLDKRLYNDDYSMKLEGYQEIYDLILTIADDADGFGLFENITDEDVEKCKWIAAILEVMNDVPLRRMEHIFKYKKIEFDSEEFLEEALG